MTAATILTTVPDLEIRATGAETIVLVPATDRVHVLNATAGRTLALADGSRDVGAIATIVAQETGAPPERVLGDLTAFAPQLVELGMLRPPEPPPGS